MSNIITSSSTLTAVIFRPTSPHPPTGAISISGFSIFCVYVCVVFNCY